MNQQTVRPFARLLDQLIYLALLVTIGLTAVSVWNGAALVDINLRVPDLPPSRP